VHPVVEEIAAARAELVQRGVEISEIHDFGGGVKGADFADPDGNSLELQEMAWRTGSAF
jgi:hypothetical protein